MPVFGLQDKEVIRFFEENFTSLPPVGPFNNAGTVNTDQRLPVCLVPVATPCGIRTTVDIEYSRDCKGEHLVYDR